MYKNVCKHCHTEVECSSSRSFSNHVLWCDKNPKSNKNTSFLVYCSCTLCKKELPIQSLRQHLKKHDKDGIPTSACLQCCSTIYTKTNKFCNHTCAAIHSNARVDRTKFKSGPPKGWQGPTIPYSELRRRRIASGDWDAVSSDKNAKYVKIISRMCKVCGVEFEVKNTSVRKCCSKDCRMSIVKMNRGRHKKSYLEQSFSDWLDSHKIFYESEVFYKNETTGKWYIIDFLFRQLGLIVELDGSHHEETAEYDRVRDEFFIQQGFKVLRITHKEYQSKKRIAEVCEALQIPLQNPLPGTVSVTADEG